MNRLLQYLHVLLKWRKLIFFNTLGLTIIAVVVSLVLPYRYTATAQLLPPPEEDPFGMASVLSGGAGSRLRRLATGGLGNSSSDLMVGVLSSRSVMKKVAERCSIIDYYRIKHHSMEGALKTLDKMTGLKVTDEGIVRINVEAKTPELAAKVANYYVEELDDFLRHSNISQGHNMRVFIERRLGQIDSTLALAQESLKVFQQRHRIVTVDEETKAAIDAYANLKSQLYVKQAELGMMGDVGSPENPYVVGLKHEIGAFQGQLRRLERGNPKDGFGAGFAVSFESLPSVTAEYLRRYRDYKIQDGSYSMLYQQYEYAKIMEARDTPALTVLDYAVPPERRSFPHRSVIVLAVFLFSLVAGIAFAFISEYFGHIQNARPEEYQGWRELRNQFLSVFHKKK
ncbi:hypothetical protein CH330_01880 [candidate division WOR-3 bacterium JGI_Cruoil_03_51_56]|uniref:Polysaccharide chain length determinant N-terminal domain-containing protein n=1 Tax=candidate division WOR-3 bacterium JGI_Cruoil_03_51_56 TaxID=1973747 RepID=A0A235BX61_UNCW3|nr:MAG: hypothetical protein CH330_01880 [candidate division WOR-3 bacterium JGI_Cruoil_03_51_56]